MNRSKKKKNITTIAIFTFCIPSRSNRLPYTENLRIFIKISLVLLKWNGSREDTVIRGQCHRLRIIFTPLHFYRMRFTWCYMSLVTFRVYSCVFQCLAFIFPFFFLSFCSHSLWLVEFYFVFIRMDLSSIQCIVFGMLYFLFCTWI